MMKVGSFRLRFEYVRGLIGWLMTRLSPGDDTFEVAGRRFPYMDRLYNVTSINERRVEVPYFYDLVSNLEPTVQVLEVGNVIARYYEGVTHPVIDKYEKSSRSSLRNLDVVEWPEDERYDLILSISTLEHVGWDEAVEDPDKILVALERLKGALNPGGRLVFSVPVGFNPHLDALLKARALPLTDAIYLRRRNWANEWEETDWMTLQDVQFGAPYSFANGLVIGIIEG